MSVKNSPDKPLVYACSGSSNLAQLANDLALWLHNQELGCMSSIAGVGGRVPKHVQIACSGRNILALDGCSQQCVKQSLAQHGVIPTWHIRLDTLGFQHKSNGSCSLAETFMAMQYVCETMGIEADDTFSAHLHTP
ncbi:zinc-binding protein [Aliidiomarina minuta]|uniref:Zinc-binding protein n=1 Tax=Aliidiomarina minuta TaxID=880057 RepID=A0A432W9G1_9GAMM|nr:putative zinc-binding protein [Aliidiomarina minuta]RUO26764.1 zinc-binding protein [Aliidiomarina minuta]